jgi:hypothetical protein
VVAARKDTTARKESSFKVDFKSEVKMDDERSEVTEPKRKVTMQVKESTFSLRQRDSTVSIPSQPSDNNKQPPLHRSSTITPMKTNKQEVIDEIMVVLEQYAMKS